MNYSFHPAAEAELLESVGYYGSKVPGLSGSFTEEVEALANLVGEPPKVWQIELPPDIRRAPYTDFRYPSFIERSLMIFKFWLLPMTGVARSTDLAGFNRAI